MPIMWPCLTSKEAGKCNLAVCSEEKHFQGNRQYNDIQNQIGRGIHEARSLDNFMFFSNL